MKSGPLFAFRAVFTLFLAAGALKAQTGGGATLVGTVRDGTGAVVVGAKITVVNTATAFVTENVTSSEGAYYIPFLAPGEYRIKVVAPGFKEYVRDGITLRSAEVPRIDIAMDVGSISDSVTVSGAASLLNTENVVSAYVISKDALVETAGVMKRTVYLLQYMPGVIGVLGQGGFHIQGQNQNDIGFSLDGIAAKSPYTGTVNQVDGVIQGSTDAMEEVKVLTTGVSAEYGHSSGGSMKMVYKSGTNQLHASFEDRYLNGSGSTGTTLNRSIVPTFRGPIRLSTWSPAAPSSSPSSTTAATRPSGCPTTPSITSAPSTSASPPRPRRKC